MSGRPRRRKSTPSHCFDTMTENPTSCMQLVKTISVRSRISGRTSRFIRAGHGMHRHRLSKFIVHLFYVNHKMSHASNAVPVTNHAYIRPPTTAHENTTRIRQPLHITRCLACVLGCSLLLDGEGCGGGECDHRLAVVGHTRVTCTSLVWRLRISLNTRLFAEFIVTLFIL